MVELMQQDTAVTQNVLDVCKPKLATTTCPHYGGLLACHKIILCQALPTPKAEREFGKTTCNYEKTASIEPCVFLPRMVLPW